ncbi:Protease prsW family protein [uncultured archaeon]|nr:Protease prsW family protein [uncultured archaeon]
MKGLAGAIFLLLLFSALHAAPPSNFATGLPARIGVPNATFYQTPSLLHTWAVLNNPSNGTQEIYLLVLRNLTWAPERALGTLAPGETRNLSIDFTARYDGQAHTEHEYVLIAAANGAALGRHFVIEEDWTPYIYQTKGELHQTAQLFIPLIGILTVLLVVLLALWGYHSKAPGAYEGEYTLRSLFLPALSGQPLGEDIADLLEHPLFWLVELGLLLGMAALIGLGLSGPGSLDVLLLTALGALAAPLIYFMAIWAYNEWVEKMPLRFFTAAFLWGCMAAMATLLVNILYGPGISQALGLDVATTAVVTAVVITPILEETLKGLGLLALSGHHEFSDALHGILLGFCVGLGFSFVENWFYFAAKTDPLQMGLLAWVALAAYRTLFNSISHACFTSAIGGYLGWAKSREWGHLMRLAFIPGLLVAAVLHAMFNLTAIWDGFSALSGDVPTYLFNPVLVLVLLAITGASLMLARDDYFKRLQAPAPAPRPKKKAR